MKFFNHSSQITWIEGIRRGTKTKINNKKFSFNDKY